MGFQGGSLFVPFVAFYKAPQAPKTGKNRTKTGNETATPLKSATYDIRRISGTLVGTEARTKAVQNRTRWGGCQRPSKICLGCTKWDKMGRFP
jgi:hypothetical protein